MLINRENFSLLTPVLHKLAASDLDLTTSVNAVRKVEGARNSVETALLISGPQR